MKATHKGTCQCCGRVQKLPSGYLAKHGYTKQWGYFQGTCSGSNEYPFEESIDLIKIYIKNARDNAASLRKLADETEKLTDVVWIHEYQKPSWERRHGYYKWREFEVKDVRVSERGTVLFYTGDDGRERRVDCYGAYEEGAVAYLNKKRATAYRKEAAHLDSYVTWQEKRIEGWEPHPEKLIEI